LLEKYPKELKIVFKNFPLQMHKFAYPASVAALAAERQGKFREYHDKLFAAGPGMSETTMQDIAKELELDVEKFNKDLNDPAIHVLINRDFNEGVQAEVNGTPALYVNGKVVKNRSAEGIGQMIEQEIGKTTLKKEKKK